MKCFASAPLGTIPLLEDELRQLGASSISARRRGVAFEGDQQTIYRIILWSRIANRILLPITQFQAQTPEDIYKEIKQIHWERHLHSSGSLAVDVTADQASVRHSHYAMLTVKDAVVDYFRDRFDERPSVDTDYPDLRLNLLLHGDRGQISIDLSGGSLHRRGYRMDGGAAPLKENLAAAILKYASWEEIAAKGGALYDPMCGSGTFLIEGAMMAADIAPGLTRGHFGFLGWRKHQPLLWEELQNEARERQQQGIERLPPIIGSDLSTQAFDAAQANIAAAGLTNQIQLLLDPLGNHPYQPVTDDGLLVVNPPYGERLGEIKGLKHDYAALGKMAHTLFAGWHIALFSGNRELVQHSGLVDRHPIALDNGQLSCHLYRYHLSKEVSLSPGAEQFANRLKKNLKHLRRWANREQISCYRLYDADLPDYSAAIDLYQGVDERHPTHLQQWIHLQEYAPPKEIDPDTAQLRLQEMEDVLQRVMSIPANHIFYKVRERQRGSQQYSREAENHRFYSVQEGRCHLWVNFEDYLDTGLFLDHRNIRLWIEAHAKDKSFLNLFGYTGSASIHAAVGGASATTTIDLSATYLDWAKRNLHLNKLPSHRHQLIRANVPEWLSLQVELKQPTHYDLIFLDPPTFSNSKRTEQTFDVQRDHRSLIENAMQLLKPGGELLFSTNFRRFQLDPQLEQHYSCSEITHQTIAEDFKRRARIHRCWRLQPRP